MRHALVLLLAVALSACGGSETASKPGAEIYDYDESKPLQLRDNGVVNENYPIDVRDVSFAGPSERVPGYLVTPRGKGPYPAVVYLHGAGGDRLEMVYRASWLAGRGAVGLTVEAPYSPSRQVRVGRGVAGLRKDRDRTVMGIVELRRAVDLLQSLPQVDDERIGFVGYSAGARAGAVLAGVEPRIRAFAFMSGGETTVDEFMALVSPEQQAEVRPLLEDTDALRYVAQARPAKVLFQAGRRDEIVPRDALETLIRAGSEPKVVKWYDAGHALNTKAERDQLDWLADVLEIEGPPVNGALTGPS